MILHKGRMQSTEEPLRGLWAAAQSGQVRIAIGEKAIWHQLCSGSQQDNFSSHKYNFHSMRRSDLLLQKLFPSFSSPVPVTFRLLSYHTKEKDSATKTASSEPLHCEGAPLLPPKKSTKFCRETSSLPLLLHVKNVCVCPPQLEMPRAMR